jgi:hypothetical protein
MQRLPACRQAGVVARKINDFALHTRNYRWIWVVSSVGIQTFHVRLFYRHMHFLIFELEQVLSILPARRLAGRVHPVKDLKVPDTYLRG